MTFIGEPEQPAEEEIELERMAEQLDEARKHNRGKIEMLRISQVQPDPLAVLALRLDALAEACLAGPMDRAKFELFFEIKMSDLLEAIDKQRSQLLKP